MDVDTAQWSVYIQDGKVGVDELTETEDEWAELYIVKQFGQEAGAQDQAQAMAFRLAKHGKLPLRTVEDEDEE